MRVVKWSDTEELRIGVDSYKGRDFFSVRVWWRTGSGEMAPGKQGINVPMERWHEVLDAITAESPAPEKKKGVRRGK